MQSVVCLYGTEVVITVDLQLFVKYGRIKDGLIRKLSDLSYIRLGWVVLILTDHAEGTLV